MGGLASSAWEEQLRGLVAEAFLFFFSPLTQQSGMDVLLLVLVGDSKKN